MRRLALVSTLVAAACGADETSGPESAGLEGPDATIRVQAEDIYRVGAIDGDSWDVFGRIASVAFDPSGNLYILDGDANHVAVVDPSGELVRTVGKQGGGPGEFQAPFGFAPLPDGRLAVFDIGKQGFQVFDETGAFLESVSVDLSDGSPGQEIGVRPDGRLVSAGGIRMSFGGPPGDGEDEEPEGRPVSLFSVDGEDREVLYDAWAPPPPETEMSETLEGGGGRSMSFSMRMQAFEPGLHVAVFPSGQVAVVDSTGYRVKILDQAGSVVEVLERPIDPLMVDDAIREAETERRLAAVDGQGGGRVMVVGGGGGGMSIDQERMQEMMRRQVESMEFAELVPVISALAVDGFGRLWVQRHDSTGDDEGPIDLLGPGGVYHGTIAEGAIEVPDAFGPDGIAAYIEEDDLGVQTVRVVRLTSPD